MANWIKINHNERTIIMDRVFSKNAENTRSEEYSHLQSVRRDYPDYKVIRKTIKHNSERETYKGLTYRYMEEYILRHESEETALEVIKEYNELRTISECHKVGHRYPTIKRWFLNRYPDIPDFRNVA